MINLIKYHNSIYIKSSKIVTAVAIWIMFILFVNSNVNHTIYDTIILSMAVLFIISTFISYFIMKSEESVAEQILVLKSKSMIYYNLSKNVYILILGILLSAVGILYPLIKYFILGDNFFEEGLQFRDVVFSFIGLSLASFIGNMLGAVMHPRVFLNHKYAPFILICIIIMTFIKKEVIIDYSFMKYVYIILPPMTNVMQCFLKDGMIKVVDILYSCIVAICYGLFLLMVQLALLNKNKY